MMKRSWVIVGAFLVLALLGACVEGEVVVGSTAVPTNLDLIQRYPTSPWSWLAWARLEPVE